MTVSTKDLQIKADTTLVLKQLKEIEARWIGENRDTITNVIELIEHQMREILFAKSLIDHEIGEVRKLKKLLSNVSRITKSRVIKIMIEQGLEYSE